MLCYFSHYNDGLINSFVMLVNATTTKMLMISILLVVLVVESVVIVLLLCKLLSKLSVGKIVKLDLSIDDDLLRLNATFFGKLVVFVNDFSEFFFSFFHDSIMADFSIESRFFYEFVKFFSERLDLSKRFENSFCLRKARSPFAYFFRARSEKAEVAFYLRHFNCAI